MLETDKFSVTDGADFVKSEESKTMVVPDDPTTSDKEQLRKLKAKHGSWGLAPLLVTPASFWQKEAIVILANACWSAHAWMSQNIVTPAQNAEHTISQSKGGWKMEILQLVLDGFLSTTNLKRLYPFQGTSETTQQCRLDIHYDFLTTLMAKRASSLSSQFLRPPLRYSALVSSNPGDVQATQAQMQADWEMILALEKEDLEGKYVRSLPSLHFLYSAVCRLAFLLNEQDCHDGSHEASTLMKSLITHFGDTLCIENTHQSAKDCLRDSRHNVRSRVHKMSAVIDSRLFQTRNTNHIAVSEVEVSTTSLKSLPAFIPLTHPNSHKMQRQFQKMMLYKSGDHWWPSTSAATQFEEAAALELLLKGSSTQEVQLNSLAGPPGTLMASSCKGVVCIVLSRAQSGVLTWAVEPMEGKESATYKCIPREAALQFHHICTLDEWVEIPFRPALHNEHGALVLEKNGPELILPLARIKNGLTMTVNEAKEVLAACGIKLPGQPSKAAVYRAVVEQFIKDPVEVEETLQISNATMQQADADGADSQLSEYQDLLDLVEEDTENRGDPDIKAEQQKVKKKRMAKPKAKASQDADGNIMLGPPKKRQGERQGQGEG